ncbi:MAG: glycosyltransferase family 9 protein [Candidatus Krumholzibacteriia bacterium]
MKVLVTRTDRIGDLVLSLPVFDFLARNRPDWELHAMVAPGCEVLVEGAARIAGVWTWSDAWAEGRRGDLVARLRSEGFDAALMLQYRRQLALLLKAAGIGRRFGPRSKPTSWVLLNKGMRQGRAGSGRHEMDLNLELAARMAGIPWPETPSGSGSAWRPRLHVGEGHRAFGRDWRAQEAAGFAGVVLVHPGSGGSALDWPASSYREVAGGLAKQPGIKVFVTGSAADADRVREVSAGIDARVGVLLERFTLGQFLGVLAAADLLVAPSTGPLHLAAALDTPTIGLFPPAPVMSPARWGQIGKDAVRMTPAEPCPRKTTCSREKCPLFNCLETVTATGVVAEAQRLLNGRTEES